MTSPLELFGDWLPRQRWFAGKGRPAHVVSEVSVEISREPDVVVRVHLVDVVYDAAGGPGQTYQVPVVLRREALPHQDGALIGVVTEAEVAAGPPSAGRSWQMYDGPHDPAFVTALLALVAGARTAGSLTPGGLRLDGVRQPGAAAPDHTAASRVMDGEQSNTSIVVASADPLIVKVFRVVADGDNPDVVVQAAIAAAGSAAVPGTTGWVEGSWVTQKVTQQVSQQITQQLTSRTHLAFVQQFFPGTQDAWRVASAAVDAGVDFTGPARALGAQTARVHQTLAASMGQHPVSADGMTALEASLLARLQWALDNAPALAAYEQAARSALHAVGAVSHRPLLQRVHGDYHLGQVLDVPGRGWVLLDFEGEPLRPLAERSAPDLALRDVAGMLRSFDYAAGQVVVHDPGAVGPAREWADSCRAAFCAGYAEVSGRDPRADAGLLRALELDKALYEVVYESRNRPDWLVIPLAAIDRLLSDVPPDQNQVTPVSAHDEPISPAVAAEVPAHPLPPTRPRTPQPQPVATVDLDRLVSGSHGDPHGVLGLHPHDGALTLRTLRPHASEVVAVLSDGTRVPLRHEHEGVFVAVVPGAEVVDYRLDVTYEGPDGTPGTTFPVDDPYRFLPTLGDVDLHLIGEGRHEQLWTVLGAQVRQYPGAMGPVSGTSFAVWAPHARGVRLVGDLNSWEGTSHPMRSLGSTGVWELFVPGVGAGTRYKFDILGPDGVRRLKADPMARAAEAPPSTASVVTEDRYTWGDDAWLARRAASDPHNGPMSTYEVHLGSWREGLGYLELAEQLVDYVTEIGFTHVELMPVMEHPYGPSWGYQVSGYYAPTARFGSPDEFRHLVDALHRAGIGVILDWVPAHFPRDAFALARFDGQALYEHPDPRRGDHPDWGTHVFDLGRPQVRNFLIANAVYWCEEFHVDGLRVDAVASMLYLDYSREDGEWLPNEYGGRENLEAVQLLQETNATLYRRVPGVVTIAEESTAWPGVSRPTHLGGLGFGLKWNMGWMHDSLDYVAHEPVHRQYHHHQMTFALMYAWTENFVLPVSHDEVVHGKGSLLRKMPGDRWQQLANVRAYLAMMWAHPGKQLVFMGTEFAQEAEWSDSRGLDWWLLDQPAHRGVLDLVRDLNAVYTSTPALWSQDLTPAGFAWIDANDAANNVFSFLRMGPDGPDDVVAVIVNFAATPHYDYRVGLPSAGRWDEVLNTDATTYGGSGVGNLGGIDALDEPWHGLPASASLSVPPLAAVWLRPARGTVPGQVVSHDG